ncbi:MAG TPA: P1 family peptidase, partial [Terriglobia bacterium]|nr:P1 family peptidase [Terriglobia bacterium]
DTARALLDGTASIGAPPNDEGPINNGTNTTLVVVATNARLNKVSAKKLAQLAQIGMARTIRPVHTMSDGDVVIALSLGTQQADVNTLGVAAADAVQEAILRGVRLARSAGGLPGLGGDG